MKNIPIYLYLLAIITLPFLLVWGLFVVLPVWLAVLVVVWLFS